MQTDTVKKEAPKRAFALDALRGYAILTMVLSGLVPWGSLPNWMYHAQTPPPTRAFDGTLAGITWVDLVFPFFIFAMGAAFPLAQRKKIARGVSQTSLSFSALTRFFLLVAFAIFNVHFNPWVFKLGVAEDPWILGISCDTGRWLMGLFGFGMMFLIFGRFPWKMSKKMTWLLKAIGWSLTAICFYNFSYGKDLTGHFDLSKNNIILHILATLAFAGSLCWIWTYKNASRRLLILWGVLALRFTQWDGGGALHYICSTGDTAYWTILVRKLFFFIDPQNLSRITNYSWLFNWGYLSYLFIIIPASIVGDLLFSWMQEKDADKQPGWSHSQYYIAAIGSFILIPLCTWGLYTYANSDVRHVLSTTWLSAIICAVLWFITRNPVTSLEKLIHKLINWGFCWLMIGLIFDPYEGGIKKDSATLSYYFVTSGLATFMLAGFSIVIDYFKGKKFVQLLIDNGQNPMIAYCAPAFLWHPISKLLGFGPLIDKYFGTPWKGAFFALMLTISLAYIVKGFTKMKIYLRT